MRNELRYYKPGSHTLLGWGDSSQRHEEVLTYETYPQGKIKK